MGYILPLVAYGLVAVNAIPQAAYGASTTPAPSSSATYACNPAHSYPNGQSCVSEGDSLTLETSMTSASTSSSTYACNPAHSYPGGSSCVSESGSLTLKAPATSVPSSSSTFACNPAREDCATVGGALVPKTSVTSAPGASSTGYACNPAHSYPAGVTCTSVSGSLTLTTSSVSASSSTYACNPAHSYPNAVCTSKGGSLTLSYSASTTPSATYSPLQPSSAHSSSGFACNPADSYPGSASCVSESGILTLKTLQPASHPTPGPAAPSATTAQQSGSATPIVVQDSVTTALSVQTSGNVCPPASTVTITSTVTVAVDQPSYTPIPSGPSVSAGQPQYTPAPSVSLGQPQYTPAPSVSLGAPIYRNATTSVPTSRPSATHPASACPLTLEGKDYQYPHLIVDSDASGKTSGPTYNATMSASETAYFNFDIPQSYAGKTCDLVITLPTQNQLQTSFFNLSGSGDLQFSQLEKGITANAPGPAPHVTLVGSWHAFAGQSFTVKSGACAAGQTTGYGVKGTGSLALEFFQDYNPCPIGLYVLPH